MDIIRSMRLFLEIAHHGSLSAAGRTLGMTPSTASRTIDDLEEWIGKPLLRRTTRHVALTDAGQQYLIGCQNIVQSVDNLKLAADRDDQNVRGTLRITSSSLVVRYFLSPLLSDFLNDYPNVSLVIDSSDQHVDLSVEQYGMAIRIGKLQDSSLVAQELLKFRTLLVASPKYLATRDAPKSLDDLSEHDCLVDTVPRFGNRWPILPGRSVASRAMIQDGETIRGLALAGHGIAYLPEFFVKDDLAAGTLQALLSDETTEQVGMYAVFLSREHITPAARAFTKAVQSMWHAKDVDRPS